jgi:LmbE family N-acetylglucosaminyl deacetylase
VTSLELDPPARALAIGAHPDDIEFGCGATLAKWAAGGCVIDLLVLTDGSKGTWDPDDDLAALVTRRAEEQQAAAATLGATGEVVMLGFTDGELEATLERRSAVARVIREHRPEVVLGHDPWKRYRLHPDHRAAGWLTIDGVVAARDPHFFPEHEIEHHRPSTILLFEADAPDHAEDVTGHGQTKVDALLCHRSQFRSTMGIGADGPVDPADPELVAFRAQVLDDLVESGRAVGARQAERFKLIDDV